MKEDMKIKIIFKKNSDGKEVMKNIKKRTICSFKCLYQYQQ